MALDFICEPEYDYKNAYSIFQFAKKLKNKTLRGATKLTTTKGLKAGTNKGLFGTLIEQDYFMYHPNSHANADFEEAGLELKTTPLKKTNKGLRAKERLVFNIINYNTIVKENWEQSSFLSKNQLLLLIFYLWEKDKNLLDYLIKYIKLLRLSEQDFEIIKQDWHTIVAKIKLGKAHELSEADTNYLSACRKGAGNKKDLRPQPQSEILALQRAFSFKPKYMNTIISSIEKKEEYEHVLNTNDLKTKSFEEVIYSKLDKFKGMSIDEICGKLKIKKPSAKHQAYLLTAKMLGVKNGKIAEFEKADIQLKTITLEKTGKLKEAMSFKTFKYNDIIEDNNWDMSPIREMFEKKFLFIIFRKDEAGVKKFERVQFFHLPYSDLMQIKSLWEKVKDNTKKGIYENISSQDNPVAHIRNHATNSKSTFPTPNGKTAKKRCFWLNREYIYDVITAEN